MDGVVILLNFYRWFWEKYLELNVLLEDLVFYRTQLRHLIHVANSTYWEKALTVVVVVGFGKRTLNIKHCCNQKFH